MINRANVADVACEVAGAELGDARLAKRLTKIASALAAFPGASFPRVACSDGELEGVYRFFSNERVTPDGILQPHFAAARERADRSGVLVLHDTTAFSFRQGSRVGLGHLQHAGAQSRAGFFGHFAFAVSADESHRPLGVVGLTTFVRTGRPLGKAITGKRRWKRGDKESARWVELALTVEQRLANPIHVMDREGDSYENFRLLNEAGARFVIRGRTGWNRIGESDGIRGTLPELTRQTPIRLRRTVNVSRRAPSKVDVLSKAHPPRPRRTAKLVVHAAPLKLARPWTYSRRDPLRGPLPLHVVCVEELNPPRDQDPISWMLLTNEPIDTRQQVAAIVDHYRARWSIEEYFKALKTGCNFEKRQLETLSALKNALAVFAVIAWRLLLLRTVSRAAPAAPATTVATTRQVRVLRSLRKVNHPRVRDVRIPPKPTAKDVLTAVAKLGGHLKRNGPPGWQVLGRGYDALLLLEMGWMARGEM
jgi:hypothetical protein